MASERKTVVDVREAFRTLRRAAEAVGANTADWDVFRGPKGYTMKLRMPWDSMPRLLPLSEHAAESTRMIRAASLGFELVEGLSNSNVVGAYKMAMLARHKMEEHRSFCLSCRQHMSGDPNYPAWCNVYRGMTETFRRGMMGPGRQ